MIVDNNHKFSDMTRKNSITAVVKIPVRPNLYVLVDAKDAEEVDDYRWYVTKSKNGRLYIQASVWDKKKRVGHSVQLTRLIAR